MSHRFTPSNTSTLLVLAFFSFHSLTRSRPRLDLFALRLSTEWQSRFFFSLPLNNSTPLPGVLFTTLHKFDVCWQKIAKKKEKFLRLYVYVIIVVKFLQRSMNNKSCWVSVCTLFEIRSLLFCRTQLVAIFIYSLCYSRLIFRSLCFFTLAPNLSLFSNRQTRTCEKIMNKKCAACFFCNCVNPLLLNRTR